MKVGVQQQQSTNQWMTWIYIITMAMGYNKIIGLPAVAKHARIALVETMWKMLYNSLLLMSFTR